MIAAFETAGFRDVHVVAHFDCFAETTKERTARKYGVQGVNLSARKGGRVELVQRGWM